MSDLTLFVDAHFESPWAMSAFIAIEEKGLPYTLRPLNLKTGEHRQKGSGLDSHTGRVPSLEHGDYWLAESVAIAEYLAETFPFPKHPRLFPENLQQRGTCREVQGWLRTDLAALRAERPTSSLWWNTKVEPLTADGQAALKRLLDVAGPLIHESRTTLFEQWCIADADLALMFRRLTHNGDPVPPKVKAYVEANWKRPSMAKWDAMKRPPLG